MNRDHLVQIAQALVAPGKGILAADESTATIGKRFAACGVDSTPETRRDYRELFFRCQGAIRQCISGVILFDETIRQNTQDATPIVQLIAAAGAIPGIKVDSGVTALSGFPGETITEGLDGLRKRLTDYRELGARFAKWRAVISVGEGIPTDYVVDLSAQALARYAALCHECDLVPIVEPEVLMDGAHGIEQCGEVTAFVLKRVFQRLYQARVLLEGIVLKPNMVTPGKSCPRQASPDEIAHSTLRVLKYAAPAAVPGIAFLSGGQSEVEATANLDAINRLGGPWALTFSFGRALQSTAMKTWAGKPENVAAAQAIFAHRAEMNSLAAQGRWSDNEENVAA